eukprot:13619218-Alexandrium_andersonii.AAC.1
MQKKARNARFSISGGVQVGGGAPALLELSASPTRLRHASALAGTRSGTCGAALQETRQRRTRK